MWQFYRSVVRSAFKEFWTATDQVLTAIAVLTFFGVLANRKYAEKLVTAWNGISPWWSVIPIALLVVYRLLRANYEKYAGVKRELDTLRPPFTVAEEDPKVYFEPLNSEFTRNGYIPFKFSNKGQRINPAQGITVQPISCVPSLKFDYIDRLDMNEERMLIPTVGDDYIFPVHDILPSLRQAWSDAHAAGGFDSAEFPFQVTIKYRDSKRRCFETVVSLKYCALEEDAARQSIMSGHHGEFSPIKVTDSDVRRFA
jgi:hypothetical protein